MNNILNLQLLLTENISTVLKNDTSLFSFKSENQLINNIIVNFHDFFIKDFTNTKAMLESNLFRNDIDTDANNSLIKDFLSDLLQTKDSKDPKTHKKNIHISSVYQDTLLKINEDLIYYFNTSATLSKYVRILIFNYSKLSRVEREKIVYRDFIKTIENSLLTQHMIKIQTHDNRLITVSPYKIYDLFDGEFLMLAGEDNKSNIITVRLTNIKSIITLNNKKPFSDENITYIKEKTAAKLDLKNLVATVGLDNDNLFETYDNLANILKLLKRS